MAINVVAGAVNSLRAVAEIEAIMWPIIIKKKKKIYNEPIAV